MERGLCDRETTQLLQPLPLTACDLNWPWIIEQKTNYKITLRIPSYSLWYPRIVLLAIFKKFKLISKDIPPLPCGATMKCPKSPLSCIQVCHSASCILQKGVAHPFLQGVAPATGLGLQIWKPAQNFKTGGSTDEAADRDSDQGSSNDSESARRRRSWVTYPSDILSYLT